MSGTHPTYPHDYAVLFAGDVKPVIVGGQAVNLWAITFLEPGEKDQISRSFASGDMDILASREVLNLLKNLPGWRFAATPLAHFGDTRAGGAVSVSDDGRKLLVEVLNRVNGLSKADLRNVTEVEYAGSVYRVLDPIVMLKAKAANVREIPQERPGEEPRHDRDHLKLLARCFPEYLRALHAASIGDSEKESLVATDVSRAFSVLQDRHTASTLKAEGIDRKGLMPSEFAESPIEKIRNAFKWQMPRLSAASPGQRISL